MALAGSQGQKERTRPTSGERSPVNLLGGSRAGTDLCSKLRGHLGRKPTTDMLSELTQADGALKVTANRHCLAAKISDSAGSVLSQIRYRKVVNLSTERQSLGVGPLSAWEDTLRGPGCPQHLHKSEPVHIAQSINGHDDQTHLPVGEEPGGGP